MIVFLSVFFKNDQGITAIEYALIASLIAVVIVGAVGLVGEKTQILYEKVDTALP